MRFALIAGVLTMLAAQPARDLFVLQRDAAAALNPHSPRFTIALEGNRTTFHIGERIPVVFTYDNLGRSTRDAKNQTYLHFADALLDRAGGVARPFDDFLRSGLAVQGGVCCGVPGGLVGGGTRFGGMGFDAQGIPFFLPDIKIPPPPPPPPVSMTFLVNEGIRFDAAGKYRLYMADRHDARYAYGSSPPPPLISNIIEFEITDRDEAWEEETLRAAVAVLDRSSDSNERSEAFRTVRFLGTRAAVDVLVERRDSRGLFGARDRDYVIDVLEKRVDDVLQPMTRFDLRTLAALKVTRAHRGLLTARDKHDAVLAVSRRRLRALARAGMLSDWLRAVFGAPPVEGDRAPVTPALAEYAREVEAVLIRLSPDQRESVLSFYSWTFGQADGFHPMLRRLAAKGSAVAGRLATDLTAPSDTPPDLARLDPTEPYVSSNYDPETKRRFYAAGGLHVAFVELDGVFRRFPRGATLQWYDGLTDIWELDRDAEFRRVERVALRYGLTLTRP